MMSHKINHKISHKDKRPVRPEPMVEAEDCLLIEYSIKCQNKILEASEKGQSIEYQMGQGAWPVQLELAMLGEAQGASLSIDIAANEQAFGEAVDENIISMSLADFDEAPEIGSLITFDLPDARQAEGQVLSLKGDLLEVDFNHPYAGRDLHINIYIHEIIAPKLKSRAKSKPEAKLS